jgi:hypothetical protein
VPLSCSWYDVVHDFAAPLATVIAAGTAVFVTWRLGKSQVTIARQQAHIAAQQAETALDRLRYDIFERRYAIYLAAQRIIELSILDNRSPSEAGELHKLYTTIGEAHFFFPQGLCDFLTQLGEECTKRRRRDKNLNWTEDDLRLLAIRDTMSKRFADALAFLQLTKREQTR